MNIVKIRNEMRNGRTIFDLPLRVTFYARVSTDRDEQLNSLENQVQYYTELIQSKRSWSYVPGYIDEGISGTSTKKRDSFLRMIQDAKDGRFDFIITKEISRFSRSTLDSIQYTQELLEKLAAKGVKEAYITLHVGLGTFRPVKAEEITEHHMHSEFCMISKETADIINETKRAGGRGAGRSAKTLRASEIRFPAGNQKRSCAWKRPALGL